MKTNKPINLNQALITKNGYTLRSSLNINLLIVKFQVSNLFTQTTLGDVLFEILENPAPKYISDMNYAKVWFDVQKKIQQGGVVTFTEAERELLIEVIPLRQSPWYVGQILTALGLQLSGQKDNSDILSTMPTNGQKNISAKSLETK